MKWPPRHQYWRDCLYRQSGLDSYILSQIRLGGLPLGSEDFQYHIVPRFGQSLCSAKPAQTRRMMASRPGRCQPRWCGA